MTDEQRSILLGGLVIGVLSSSYLGIINMLCCLGVMIGAAAGVWHFASEQRTTLDSGEGARLGASAAVVGLFVSLVLNFLLAKIGLGAEQALSGILRSGMSDVMTDQQLEMMRRQMEEARQRSFFETVFSLGTLSNLLVFPLFGAAGGAAGATLFGYGDAGPGEQEAEYEIIDE